MTQIVLSNLQLVDYGSTWTQLAGGVQLYEGVYYDYAALYRTQPNVRTCVDFLARNIAQLGLHVYRRVSDTDRQRLLPGDSDLAQVLAHPNPWITAYRLIESLVVNLGIYGNAYWLKVVDDVNGMMLLPIPSAIVTAEGTGFAPGDYRVSYANGQAIYKPEEIVHFRNYNPDDPKQGLSPLETLRRILAEEQAAGDYREYYWQNAARINGVIERPATSRDWSEAAKARFKKDLQAFYAGAANSGSTMILEDGMTFKPNAFNPQESEYLAGRKLTREECARAYHIPLPMVGILEHSTYANIREQHKNLYQDCLGPWLRMIEEEIELQLGADMPDMENVYCEFNIQEKLSGSFEEQVDVLNRGVGRPYMVVNEARAKLNLPSIAGGDELAVPLNMMMVSEQPTVPPVDAAKAQNEIEMKARAVIDPTQPKLRAQYVQRWKNELEKYFRRQERTIRSRAGSGNVEPNTLWTDKNRWLKELTDELFKLGIDTAWAWASYMAAELDANVAQEPMEAYVRECSEITAGYVTDDTVKMTTAALRAEEPENAIRDTFDHLATITAGAIAIGKVTQMANFGAHEGARQAGLKTKTWRVNSQNPRPEHAAMDGMTVNLNDIFYPTGQRWPGDPVGGAENNANCECSLEFGR